MRQRAKLAARARPRPADPAARRAVQRHGPAPAAAHDGPAALDGGRGPDDPVLARTSSRRSSGSPSTVLVVYAGRLAASGDFRAIRRLMTDRPHTFTVRSSDDRRLAAALLAEPAVFGVELVRRPALGPDRRLRGRSPASLPARRPRRRGDASSRCADRRLARERVRATWCADDGHGSPIGVTLRGLLGRRRTLLMLLLVAAAGRSSGCSSRVRGRAGEPDADRAARHARRPDGPAARRAHRRDGGARLGDRGRDAPSSC